jgi:hypothetical protein
MAEQVADLEAAVLMEVLVTQAVLPVVQQGQVAQVVLAVQVVDLEAAVLMEVLDTQAVLPVVQQGQAVQVVLVLPEVLVIQVVVVIVLVVQQDQAAGVADRVAQVVAKAQVKV